MDIVHKSFRPGSNVNRYFKFIVIVFFLVFFLSAALSVFTAEEEKERMDNKIIFQAQSRDREADANGNHKAHETKTEWKAKETAVIICDMWDKHHCNNATRRVGEMVPRMNQLIDALRKQGTFIIHAPSDTMEFYQDTPQRKRAQNATVTKPPVPIQDWCSLEPDFEIALPIDDSDGGCDDIPPTKDYRAWTSEHPDLHIEKEDAVSDIGAEIYNLIAQNDIENIIMMGVHTNMCVLGRPFGIRQMTKLGLNVVLVRDLTDTMYNPRMSPFVSHKRGTEMVVEHIEKYWAPTTQTADLLEELAAGISLGSK